MDQKNGSKEWIKSMEPNQVGVKNFEPLLDLVPCMILFPT